MSDTVIVDANVLFSPSMQDALNDKLLNIGAAKIIIIFFFTTICFQSNFLGQLQSGI